MRVVKTYCPERIVSKRTIFTIAGKLTVTLRHHITDKKTIICYIVVEAIVSRCQSIVPSCSCTLLFSSTPVVKDDRSVSRLLRLHIPVSFSCHPTFFSKILFIFIQQRDTQGTLFRPMKSFGNDVCIAIYLESFLKLKS